MKTFFKIFIMLTAVAVFQGCQSKEEKAKEENDKSAAVTKANEEASATQQAEARAAKKKQIEKQTAEKAAAREITRAAKLKASTTYTDASGRLVYNKAEVDPSYSGGTDEMREFLRKNLKYPEAAKDKGLEGTVFVDFVIDEKGRVREVVASDVAGEDVDLSLKEESVRVVASMPLWKPGTQHGKSVDTSFSIPITFEIN